MSIDEQARASRPRWMAVVLVLAGVYNLLWGGFVVLFPLTPFRWAGMEPPNYPELWQCIGMIVGVYGVGYLAAAFDPLRHWPIVLVGLLGKLCGPLGFLEAALAGRLPWVAGLTILTNDLIWWVPFAGILVAAWRKKQGDDPTAASRDFPAVPANALRDLLRTTTTSTGTSLEALSQAAPTLVVFLRHAGCTFCREALADIRLRRRFIEAQGTQIVLVHQGGDAEAAEFFARYDLANLARVSDPQRRLYQAFGLARGTLRQLFGLDVWWRGLRAGLVAGHGVGPLVGDGRQMPGIFLLVRGRVVRGYRHATAADRPDYVALARCEECATAG